MQSIFVYYFNVFYKTEILDSKLKYWRKNIKIRIYKWVLLV